MHAINGNVYSSDTIDKLNNTILQILSSDLEKKSKTFIISKMSLCMSNISILLLNDINLKKPHSEKYLYFKNVKYNKYYFKK